LTHRQRSIRIDNRCGDGIIDSPEKSSFRIRTLLGWSAIQCAILLLAWSAVPLWATQPAPRESAALAEMMVVQIAASSLLFPILLENFWTTLAVALLACLFIHLAGKNSGAAENSLLAVCGYVSLWIIGLGCMSVRLSTRALKLSGIWVFSLWTLGGVLLWYLRLESDRAGKIILSAQWFSPIFGALSVSQKIKPNGLGWLVAGLPLLAACLDRAARKNFDLAPTTLKKL
jgi:hypothetical protein